MASAGTPARTSPPLVSVEAFHGIIWAGFAVCVIGFASRITIRIACFRRLFLEDYLMMVSLCLLLASTILGHLFVAYVYNMMAVGNGTAMPSPNFMSETTAGNHAFGAFMVLNIVGIWLVKLNFLLFFRRLGNHVKIYRILWWSIVAFNLAAGAIFIGLVDFGCLTPPAEEVIANCATASVFMKSYTASKVSCSLDAVGDALILGFPLWILWGCKVSVRHKIVLSGIFGLVAFTIAVTIIRGSIFGGIYQSISKHDMRQLNVTWIWFWFNIEFDVAFTIGCLVSFRALFTERAGSRRQAKLRERQKLAVDHFKPKPTGIRAKAQALHDVLLTTFHEWEDATGVSDDDVVILPQQSTGIMIMDFERGGAWTGPHDSRGSVHGDADSAQMLEAKEGSTRARLI